MAILDAAMGLIPLRTPLESETYNGPCSGTLYPGQPVALAGGAVIAYATGLELLGVCMDYKVSGENVTVCTAKDMRYRVKGNSNFAQTDVGLFADFIDPDLANIDTLRSAAVADTTNAGAAPASANECLQIVGEYKVITPEAEAQWFAVRLHTLTLS